MEILEGNPGRESSEMNSEDRFSEANSGGRNLKPLKLGKLEKSPIDEEEK